MKIYNECELNDFKINNYILNINEILEHKVFLNSSPLSAQILLSNKCNLKCRMCNFKEYHDNSFMNKKEIEKIIENNPQLITVEWSGGGEPLLHPDIEYFIDLAELYKIKQIIITNALLFTEKLIKKISKYNVNLVLSIDGGSKKVYENIRLQGKYDNLIKNIKSINNYRSKFNSKSFIKIYCVVIRENYLHLTEMIDFCYKYNIKEVLFLSDSVENKNNIILYGTKEEKKELSNILKRTIAYSKEKKVICSLDEKLKDILYLNKNKKNNFENNDKSFCLTPWQQIRILPKGEVFPTYFCDKSIGNIFNNSLSEIWNSDTMIKYRTEILKNKNNNICSQYCSSKNFIIKSYTAMERFLHTLMI